MRGRARIIWWLGSAIFLTPAARAALEPEATTKKPAPIPVPDKLPGEPENLPFGFFPSIREAQDNPRGPEDLKTEIKDLQSRVESTVRTVANRRNVTCFGDPCIVQAFPLIYNSAGSGFFAGFRLNLSNMARTDPRVYSFDAHIVRSDTHQWVTSFALDFPKVEAFPLQPRIKMRFNYSRTTQDRYYGIGPSSAASLSRPTQELRYALQETGFQTSLVVPFFNVGAQKVHAFASFNSIRFSPARLDNSIPSKLFEDSPLGSEGGISARMGLGLLIDNRDTEVYARRGWATELAFESAGRPIGRYPFHRYSLIDRRYLSSGNYTFAMRFNLDSLEGAVPFWELTSLGGIDPIREVSSAEVMRGVARGRFHERVKIILSVDNRVHFRQRRVFGLLCEPMLVPVGVDLGRLGSQGIWSLSTGANFLFNKSFEVRTMGAYSPTGYEFRLAFGQEY